MKSIAASVVVLISLAIAAVGEERPGPGPASASGDTSSTQPTATRPATERPLYAGHNPDEWSSYQAMHAFFLQRFVESRGFGMERMVNVNDPRFRKVYADGMRYTVGSVQLLSLNDGKIPFAYVTGIDADKRLIQNAAHQPVVEPEIDALAKLKEGMTVVLTGQEGHREMIGAIRATADCTRCHGVAEGTLLGAFRYPLQRAATPQLPRQGKAGG